MDEWLSPDGLAAELGMPVRTIYAWRVAGKGPRGHKIGKHVRFRRSDVERWLSGCADEPNTGDAA
jgi:excisionase family DNA binding protein